METYNLASATKNIYNSGLNLFTLKTLRDILEIGKESTLFSVIRRLTENEVLIKIEKNKYALQNGRINDFALANFIYQPSYISFESALNFYGILSQFPYEVASTTSKKPQQKVFDDKIFSYIHLKKDLFWGYQKKEDFLIALPEKALLDQLYLASKGLRKADVDEYDFSLINFKMLRKYLNKYPQTRQFMGTVKNLRKYIKQ
ncbi:hypothetical protein KKB83_05145 [Patescibacteria group bacterium]|nr:hypothetical protein [Patescibacteria group bacterium]